MEDILDNLKSDLNKHFNGFLIHVSKRYRVNVKNLLSDFEKYQSGELEVLENESLVTSPAASPSPPKRGMKGGAKGAKGKSEPVKTANVIKNLVGDSDSESDAQSEVKTRVKQLNTVIDSSASSSSDSEDVEVEIEEKEEKDDDNSEATVTLSGSEEQEIELESESSSDEPLPKKGNKKGTGKKVVIEEPPSEDTEDEDDEPSESEPLPKTKKGGKGKKQPAKKEKVAKEKKSTKKSIKDLVDKPKTPTECSVPKGTQFLKGTNLVVVKGKVVAAVNKKGFVKLDKRYLKSFDNPDYADIKHEVWDKEKVDKKFNK